MSRMLRLGIIIFLLSFFFDLIRAAQDEVKIEAAAWLKSMENEKTIQKKA